MVKLISLIICLYTFVSFSDNYAQNEWSKIVYYNSNGENSTELKMYYIITVNSSGEGKLEYFNIGKVNEYEFQSGKKSFNKFKRIICITAEKKFQMKRLKKKGKNLFLPFRLNTMLSIRK